MKDIRREAINYQQRFWVELIELKAHIYYLESFYLQAVRIETALETFLAVVSNASIAGWVIWSKAQFLWASIIALSHLISAIRPQLPFQKRVRNLEPLINELRDLSLYAEERWYEVSEGLLTNQEINKLTLEIQSRKQKVSNLYLSSIPLPINSKYLSEAGQLTQVYFQKRYPGEN